MTEMKHPTAELAVAAAMLKEESDLFAIVQPTDFSSPQLRVLTEAVQRLLNGVEPLDAKAILSEARHVAKELKLSVMLNEELITKLQKTDTRRADAYAHTVKRFSWLRQFQETIEWANKELQNYPDPEEMYTHAQERLAWLRPPTNDKRFVFGGDTLHYVDVLTRRQEERKLGRAIRFDFPWPAWNRHVRTLRPGMLGLLSGPEGSGKSSYLEMIAEHWATKCHVVFVHLENSIEYTLDRRMCRHARLPIELVEDNDLSTEQKEIVCLAEERMMAFAPQLHYLDASGRTMTEIVAELRARRDDGLCDAVVLDYLNKVRSSRGQMKLYGTDGYARQADDLELLKSFCEEPGQKVPGFTAAQFNKEGKQNNGRLSGTNIRGTGEYMDKVQLAVLIQRTITDKPMVDELRRPLTKPGQKDPRIKVRIDKQNRGSEVEFEQIHKGEYFLIGDQHV